MSGDLEKPVIAAINGYAMGGGFMLVERTDLRVAAKGAIFEVSEAKRWLLGGYNHGHIANLPYPIAMEMALGFRFTAERFYDIGFITRLAEPDNLMGSAFAMAEHLLTLPPASRVNTVHMMRQMRPAPSPEQERLGARLGRRERAERVFPLDQPQQKGHHARLQAARREGAVSEACRERRCARGELPADGDAARRARLGTVARGQPPADLRAAFGARLDRKSTRLNSSHPDISR